MPAPAFIAEVVSPGNESSPNYLRDYIWKRQQYQTLEVPEYWIIDRHRQQVTVLVLRDGQYIETVYHGDQLIGSIAFPTLKLTSNQVLAG